MYNIILISPIILYSKIFKLENNMQEPKNTPIKEKEIFNEKTVLIISILIAGLCSIVYELLISTTSSYFLGDSITQFSITIGVYMAAMGVGSFLTRMFQKDLLLSFIGVEIILGLIGGSSVPILYYCFPHVDYWTFQVVMIGLIVVIGVLTGLEVPLLARIMKKYYPLKINLSNVLSVDYFGALIATLLFPFVLLPWIGVFKSSLIFGWLNIGLGIINLWYFSDFLNLKKRRIYGFASFLASLYFLLMLLFSQVLLDNWSDNLYRDDIIFNQQTPYQYIVLTKGGDDVRLYLNRVIQFSSVDEYRYHESITHIPLSLARYKKNVLVLGGGEGLAIRELLKHPEIESITVVDLDPEMFRLAIENPHVSALNEHSLTHPKVTRIANDAFVYLQFTNQLYDLIIADLPDPTNDAIARLYSQEFFRLVHRRLTPSGLFVTQASSPYHTNRAFWSIEASMEAGGFKHTLPYHAYVPSFGDWGFVMGSDLPLDTSRIDIQVPTQFLENTLINKLFYFEKDVVVDTILPSSLDDPRVLEYYLEDWRRWSRELTQSKQ